MSTNRSVRAKSRTAFERSEKPALEEKKKGLDFARTERVMHA